MHHQMLHLFDIKNEKKNVYLHQRKDIEKNEAQSSTIINKNVLIRHQMTRFR